jgi:hypothetical protein
MGEMVGIKVNNVTQGDDDIGNTCGTGFMKNSIIDFHVFYVNPIQTLAVG